MVRTTCRDGSQELLLYKLYKHLNLWYKKRDVVLLRFLCYQQFWCTSILFCYCERWRQFRSYVSVELVLKSSHLHHQMFILFSQQSYLFYQQFFSNLALKLFWHAHDHFFWLVNQSCWKPESDITNSSKRVTWNDLWVNAWDPSMQTIKCMYMCHEGECQC